mmetsp:Transcript_8932/g.16067  ORF Transcript_8932/g.16067 Transcript_8932/m.16067 type:complete len:564 (-) Transcript_8932:92-1783(-)|eukprot:CAMPEP_0177758742 /NCGR_PEP_ID=MMETSP0491_2-20121128/4352_1 /TAXON_ID=63592 /ORGANISM="Tetraselmis chuii, Strain PLY429" /LENGTH=563 /DNA_ID=CAMNT_0019274507 /DNA_START=486 /DNA_END=2177 /DNA_ORIENTATION=-
MRHMVDSSTDAESLDCIELPGAMGYFPTPETPSGSGGGGSTTLKSSILQLAAWGEDDLGQLVRSKDWTTANGFAHRAVVGAQTLPDWKAFSAFLQGCTLFWRFRHLQRTFYEQYGIHQMAAALLLAWHVAAPGILAYSSVPECQAIMTPYEGVGPIFFLLASTIVSAVIYSVGDKLEGRGKVHAELVQKLGVAGAVKKTASMEKIPVLSAQNGATGASNAPGFDPVTYVYKYCMPQEKNPVLVVRDSQGNWGRRAKSNWVNKWILMSTLVTIPIGVAPGIWRVFAEGASFYLGPSPCILSQVAFTVASFAASRQYFNLLFYLVDMYGLRVALWKRFTVLSDVSRTATVASDTELDLDSLSGLSRWFGVRMMIQNFDAPRNRGLEFITGLTLCLLGACGAFWIVVAAFYKDDPLGTAVFSTLYFATVVTLVYTSIVKKGVDICGYQDEHDGALRVAKLEAQRKLLDLFSVKLVTKHTGSKKPSAEAGETDPEEVQRSTQQYLMNLRALYEDLLQVIGQQARPHILGIKMDSALLRAVPPFVMGVGAFIFTVLVDDIIGFTPTLS